MSIHYTKYHMCGYIVTEEKDDEGKCLYTPVNEALPKNKRLEVRESRVFFLNAGL